MPAPSGKDQAEAAERDAYAAVMSEREWGPLQAEIDRLHARGAAVEGDVPAGVARFQAAPALAGWCKAQGGKLRELTIKAPHVSGPPRHYCEPPKGQTFWPPPNMMLCVHPPAARDLALGPSRPVLADSATGCPETGWRGDPRPRSTPSGAWPARAVG